MATVTTEDHLPAALTPTSMMVAATGPEPVRPLLSPTSALLRLLLPQSFRPEPTTPPLGCVICTYLSIMGLYGLARTRCMPLHYTSI